MRSSAVRKRVAAVAAACLAVGGAATLAAPAASARFTDLSTLHVTTDGQRLEVSGPHNIQAGLVKIVLANGTADKDITAALIRLTHGWTFADYRAALAKLGGNVPPKQALATLNQAIAHTEFLGGVDTEGGHTASMVVRLAPGTYTLYRGGGTASSPHTFTVFGSPIYRSHPQPTATVIAKQSNRFGGDAVLPASGTIRFVNRSDYSPHMVFLQHVKPGTTRQDVLAALTGLATSNPMLPGFLGTDILSPGHSQTLTYRMPKGTYAELCFMPDPKTGTPHAFMGMVGIVELH